MRSPCRGRRSRWDRVSLVRRCARRLSRWLPGWTSVRGTRSRSTRRGGSGCWLLEGRLVRALREPQEFLGGQSAGGSGFTCGTGRSLGAGRADRAGGSASSASKWCWRLPPGALLGPADEADAIGGLHVGPSKGDRELRDVVRRRRADHQEPLRWLRFKPRPRRGTCDPAGPAQYSSQRVRDSPHRSAQDSRLDPEGVATGTPGPRTGLTSRSSSGRNPTRRCSGPRP